jgi:acyl-CoA thioester hydrolase
MASPCAQWRVRFNAQFRVLHEGFLMMGLRLEDFPSRTYDKLRYGDTDRQGHVNNAVFATLFETGRVHVFHEGETPLLVAGFSFVIARIVIDYRAELFWPGLVEIGTGVTKIGNSSMTFAQALFQAGRLAATAESVVVQVGGVPRKAAALPAETKARLAGMMINPA